MPSRITVYSHISALNGPASFLARSRWENIILSSWFSRLFIWMIDAQILIVNWRRWRSENTVSRMPNPFQNKCSFRHKMEYTPLAVGVLLRDSHINTRILFRNIQIAQARAASPFNFVFYCCRVEDTFFRCNDIYVLFVFERAIRLLCCQLKITMAIKWISCLMDSPVS